MKGSKLLAQHEHIYLICRIFSSQGFPEIMVTARNDEDAAQALKCCIPERLVCCIQQRVQNDSSAYASHLLCAGFGVAETKQSSDHSFLQSPDAHPNQYE